MLYLSMSDASYFSLGTDETLELKPKEGKPRQKKTKTTLKSHVGIWVLRARVYPASVTSP
jgi:hypothetical protein